MFQALKNNRNLLAAAFLVLMLLMLLLGGMPSREVKLISAYLWPATVTLLVVMGVVLLRKPSPVGVVGMLLACWFVVCTVANGDHYLEFNLRYVCGVTLTFGAGLPLFQVLEGKTRDRWLTITAVCVGAVAAFIALLGAYACLMDCQIRLPVMEGTLGITWSRLYAFGKHPNEIGCLLNLGLLCWLMLTFQSRPVWLKICCLLPVIPIYFAQALTVSRTSITIAALALGGTCLVAITNKGGWKRWVIGGVVMGVVTGLALYGVMTVIPRLLPDGTPAVNQATTTVQITQPETVDAAVETTAPVSQAEAKPLPAGETQVQQQANTSQYIQQRGFSEGLSTFSQRTEIWQAGIDYLRQNPRTLLLGNTDGQVARIPGRALDRDIYHMHNTYLECLLLVGIPGLIMYLFVLGNLLWYAAKQFFSKKTPAWRRVLAAAPVVMLISTLMEIYPSVSGHASDMIMLALTGAVIAYGRSKEPVETEAK